MGYDDCVDFVTNCVDLQLKRIDLLLQKRKEVNGVVLDLEKKGREYWSEVDQTDVLLEKVQQNQKLIDHKIQLVKNQLKDSLAVLLELETVQNLRPVLSEVEKNYFVELEEMKMKVDTFHRKLKGYNDIVERQKERESEMPLSPFLKDSKFSEEQESGLIEMLKENTNQVKKAQGNIDDLKCRLDHFNL